MKLLPTQVSPWKTHSWKKPVGNENSPQKRKLKFKEIAR
jgi:hypothetical protein